MKHKLPTELSAIIPNPKEGCNEHCRKVDVHSCCFKAPILVVGLRARMAHRVGQLPYTKQAQRILGEYGLLGR